MKAISISAILACAVVALVVTIALQGEVRTPFGTLVLSPLAEKLGLPAAAEALKPVPDTPLGAHQPVAETREESVVRRPSQPASSGVYRWTDADGRVHYGDRPPQSADAAVFDEQLLSGNVIRAPQTAPQRTHRPTNLTDTTRVTAAARNDVTWRAQRCKQVKAQIERIDARMRRPYTAQQGEYYRARRRPLVDERNKYCH